jgi:hypothetical protein
MRRALVGLALLAGACTQDFDAFTIGEVGGAAGLDASAGGAPPSGGSAGVPAAGGAPLLDASPDADASVPDAGCPEGTKDCDGVCLSISDPASGCGDPSCAPCSFPNAVGQCSTAGECEIGPCLTGFSNCNAEPGDGCEVELATDTRNCGGCGKACVVPNATPSCEASVCGGACNSGFADCNAEPGCETNVAADPKSCGGCLGQAGVDCTLQAGNWVCEAGQCKVSQCPTGKGDCDKLAANGCEVDLTTDANHCNFCGNICNLKNAIAECKASACAIKSCEAGYADCDGLAGNGCETELAASAAHCGKCARPCLADASVSTARCVAGVCDSTCAAGRGNCSKPAQPAADDGCETDLLGDPANCGGCGQVCSSANVATPGCTGGRCTPTCRAGFDDCNRSQFPQPNDGCETPTSTDPNNCGQCGRVCIGGQVCSGGVCACPSGQTLCGTQCRNLQTDDDHCGACDRACSLYNVDTRTCAGGVCTSTCTTGWGNCGARPQAPAPDDGCETNLNTSVRNCGSCGRSCNSTRVLGLSCNGGRCDSSCQLGYANCNQPDAGSDDGCELDVRTRNSQCGSCANSCTAQNGMKCGVRDAPDGTCGCDNDAQCRTGATGTCTSAGVCACLIGGTCRPGEVCVSGSCNCGTSGTLRCGSTETCCQTPAGCFNLSNNRDNCGACGRACPPAFRCSSGQCACDDDGDCDAGGGGSCQTGVCRCGTATCSAGQRCLAPGTCG